MHWLMYFAFCSHGADSGMICRAGPRILRHPSHGPFINCCAACTTGQRGRVVAFRVACSASGGEINYMYASRRPQFVLFFHDDVACIVFEHILKEVCNVRLGSPRYEQAYRPTSDRNNNGCRFVCELRKKLEGIW